MSYNQPPPPPSANHRYYSQPITQPPQAGPPPPPPVAEPGPPPPPPGQETFPGTRFVVRPPDDDELDHEDRGKLLEEMSKEERIGLGYTQGLPELTWNENGDQLTIGFGSLALNSVFDVVSHIDVNQSFQTNNGELSAVGPVKRENLVAEKVQVTWEGKIGNLRGEGTITFDSSRGPSGFFTTGHKTAAEQKRQRHVLLSPAPPPPPDSTVGPEPSSDGGISATEGTEPSTASSVLATTAGTQ